MNDNLIYLQSIEDLLLKTIRKQDEVNSTLIEISVKLGRLKHGEQGTPQQDVPDGATESKAEIDTGESEIESKEKNEQV